jgi:hypothetical protein
MLFQKIIEPKLKNEQSPELFVMRGRAGFVFFNELLNKIGVEQTLIFQP